MLLAGRWSGGVCESEGSTVRLGKATASFVMADTAMRTVVRVE